MIAERPDEVDQLDDLIVGWRALVVPVTGPLHQVVIGSHDEGLTDLRAHTGARFVEHIRLSDGESVWFDHDGALSDPPREINPRMSAWLAGGDGWPLRGPAVITGRPIPTGRITSLGTAALADLRRRIGGDQ